MRPRHLTVDGLACFKDKQELDLSALDLFAISGPTGAGKSTLLDALTLALYGQVPRVSKQDRSEMISASRDRASVLLEFRVGDDQYRIARTLRRGGGHQVRLDKHDGSDFTTNLADQVREADEKVAEILGLDATAFMQAVVLPQGEFARFLKAQPSERRSMLRSLLRLDFYESMRAQAERISNSKRSAVATTRKVLADEYAGVTEDSLDELHHRHSALVDTLKELRESSDEAQRKLLSVREKHRLSVDLTRNEAELLRLEKDGNEVARLRERVHASQRAQPIVSLLDEAHRADAEAEDSLRNLELAQKQQSEATDESERASVALEDAETATEDIAAHRNQIALLNQAVGRLQEAQNLEDTIARQVDEADEIRGELTVLDGCLKDSLIAEENHSREIEQARNSMRTSGYSADINDLLDGVRERAARLGSDRSKAAELAGRVSEKQQEAEEAAAELATIDNALEKFADAQEKHSDAIERARESMQASGYDAFLDELLDGVREQATELGTARRNVDETTGRYSEKEVEIEELRDKLSPLEHDVETKRAAVVEAAAGVQQADDALQHARQLDAANHLREGLKPNALCPVCERPVTSPPPANITAEVDSAKSHVTGAKKRLERIETENNTAKQACTRAKINLEAEERNLAHLATLSVKAQEQVVAKEAALRKSLGDAAPPDDVAVETWIANSLVSLAIARKAYETARSELDEVERALQRGQAESKSAQVRHAERLRTRSRIEDELRAEREMLGASENGIAAEDRSLRGLLGEQAPSEDIAIETWIANSVSSLAAARKVHDAGKRDLDEAERKLQGAQSESKLAETRRAEKQRAWDQVRIELESTRVRLSKLRAEVSAITTSDDPAAEAAALDDKIEALQGAMRTAATVSADAKNRLTAATEALKQRAEAAERATQEAQARALRRDKAITGAGFENEAAVQGAVLEPNEIAALAERIRKHEDDLHAVKRRLQELADALGDVRVADDDLQAANDAAVILSAEVQAKHGDQKTLEAEIERMKERLERSLKIREQLASDESALRTYNQMASDLRSDKFQAYLLQEAFTELVRGASARLLTLTSERYSLLYRDDNIVVVDNDNAGETRISDTLSGGETFLTSLSLALELSNQVQRAAGAVNLDSLFIDEGFGTLDPDTLAIVAEALQNLRVGGRMVGIITHIPELRDEFPQRIIVTKHQGYSTVEVHGAPVEAVHG